MSCLRAHHATQGTIIACFAQIKYSTSEGTSSCNLICLQTPKHQVPCHSDWPPVCHMTLVTQILSLSPSRQCCRSSNSATGATPGMRNAASAFQACTSSLKSRPASLCIDRLFTMWCYSPVPSACRPCFRTCCRSRSRVAGVTPEMR